MISLSLSRRKSGRSPKTRRDVRRTALARGKRRKYFLPFDGMPLTTRKHRTRGLDYTITHASSALQSIVSAVNELPPDELLDRFHELLDARLAETIDVLEGFELEMIEARLDAEDRVADASAETRYKQWKQRQAAVLESIEHLIKRLRTSR